MPSSERHSSARVRPAEGRQELVSDSDGFEPRPKPRSERRREERDNYYARMESGGRTESRTGDSRGREKDKDKDKKAMAPASGGGCGWQRILLTILFLCGPAGTVISFLLLPKDADGSDISHHSPMGTASGGVTRVRMVHLTLAESDRRARFVLDEHTDWDTFLTGCRERLQVKNIRKVTDSSGEAILAVEDLVHDDHLVIYATQVALRADAPSLPGADDITPADVPIQGASSAAVLIGAKSRFLLNASSGSESSVSVGGSSSGGGGSSSNSGGGGGGGGKEEGGRKKQRASAPQLLSQLNALQHAASAAGVSEPSVAVVDESAKKATGGPEDGASYAAQVLREAGVSAKASASSGGTRSGGSHSSSSSSSSSSSDGGDGSSSSSSRKGGGDGGDATAGGGGGGTAAAAAGGGSAAAAGGGSSDEAGAAGGGGTEEAVEHDGHEGDPLYDQENPSKPCGKRHPEFRIAMLIPWVNDLPPWLSYFIATAQRSDYLVDWLIFHEELSPPRNVPHNVQFVDLGAGGLSQLLGLKMGEELGMPVKNASLLIRSMRFMLEKWPRLVAEYKPAFGTVFEQYIGEQYTHWGYCDLDMVMGNLNLFLEHKELATQDIVSYSFGDMDALYLRGQWTVHRNRRDVSTIWKGCPHLGEELQKELLMKVAWVRRMESRGVKNYPKRFQSAEGCYSHRATQLPHVKIKVAHKQFVGLSVPSEEVIYSVNGAIWSCPKSSKVDVEELRRISTQPCSADLPGVQEPLGDLLPLEVTPDGGCGKWMPYEYRMCALNLPEPPERERDTIGFNTYLKEGKFYAQRFRSTIPVLDNGCKQGAFFHMQEWKKIWGYGSHGVDPLELVFTQKRPPTFEVTTEGISLLQ